MASRHLTERELLDRDVAALLVGAPIAVCVLLVMAVGGWWNDRRERGARV